MRLLFGLTLGTLSATASPAAELAWQDVVIAYDPAIWSANPPTGNAGLRFVCIAADCEGQPTVYGDIREMPQGDAADAIPRCAAFVSDDRQRTVALGQQQAGSVAFSAVSRWSGCRAADVPILEACATHNGMLYHLATRLASGCNFAAELPIRWFAELLHGIRASEAGK